MSKGKICEDCGGTQENGRCCCEWDHRLAELEAALDAERKQVAELERDRERLEEIIRCEAAPWVDGKEDCWRFCGGRGATAREAIDAAREAAKG